MSTKELKCVLKFIRNKGACYESEVWNQFVMGESIEERARVVKALDILEMKGLITQGVNDEADNVIMINDIEYKS